MSYRVKLAWSALLPHASVWGFYFGKLAQKFERGELSEPLAVQLFLACLVVVIIVQVALSILATVTTSAPERAARDEREQDAALKAGNFAFMTMTVVLAGLAGFSYFYSRNHPDLLDGQPLSAMVLAALNIGLLALVLAEIVRQATQITLLNRSN